jgi:hypothetical protein
MDTHEHRAALISALTTEHFVLQTAASSTISEAGTRSNLYVMVLSSSLVAMGFLSQSPALLVQYHPRAPGCRRDAALERRFSSATYATGVGGFKRQPISRHRATTAVSIFYTGFSICDVRPDSSNETPAMASTWSGASWDESKPFARSTDFVWRTPNALLDPLWAI